MSNFPHRSLRIDCDQCVMDGTDTCADCVVTFLCERDPHRPTVLRPTEVDALAVLGRAGLVPPLRLTRR